MARAIATFFGLRPGSWSLPEPTAHFGGQMNLIPSSREQRLALAQAEQIRQNREQPPSLMHRKVPTAERKGHQG